MLQSRQETQASILELLKAKGALSTNQLAQALDFHPVSIRQRLIKLEVEGYVTHRRVKIPRGRPTKMYELTDKGHSLFPSDYVSFVLKLIQSIEHLDGKEKLGKHFQNIMVSMVFEGAEEWASLSFTEKVQALCERLNEVGYMAESEENAEGFVIKMCHCPIERIADEYPQICEQERNLMRELLGTPVERHCHKIKGDCLCSYHISSCS